MPEQTQTDSLSSRPRPEAHTRGHQCRECWPGRQDRAAGPTCSRSMPPTRDFPARHRCSTRTAFRSFGLFSTPTAKMPPPGAPRPRGSQFKCFAAKAPPVLANGTRLTYQNFWTLLPPGILWNERDGFRAHRPLRPVPYVRVPQSPSTCFPPKHAYGTASAPLRRIPASLTSC